MSADVMPLWSDEAARGAVLPLGPGYLIANPPPLTDADMATLWEGVTAGSFGVRAARTLGGSLTCEPLWSDLSGGARPLEADGAALDGHRVRLRLAAERLSPAFLSLAAPGTAVTETAAGFTWAEESSVRMPGALPGLLWAGQTPFGLAAIRFACARSDAGLKLDFGAPPDKGIDCRFTALRSDGSGEEAPWQVRWLDGTEGG